MAATVADLCRVHRYDQRGTGGSPWDGEHTIARHVRDLGLLLDAFGHDRVVLVGHSFGTDLVSFFLLADPERVAGIVYLTGPFLGAWSDPTHVAEASRRSEHQQARLRTLQAISDRSAAEEIEFLTLSWFPDHADPKRAWGWAQAAARSRRPIKLWDERPAQHRQAPGPAGIADRATTSTPTPGHDHHRRRRRSATGVVPAQPRRPPRLRRDNHPGCRPRTVARAADNVQNSVASGTPPPTARC